MKYWLHRISYHSETSYPLLDKNLMSIGFSDFANEKEFIEKTLIGDWNSFEKSFDNKWGNRPRTRYNLWRFIAEMRKGDWVLIPSWGTFSIYEIFKDKLLSISEINNMGLKDWHGNAISKKDGLLYDSKGDKIDLGFVREIKPIAMGIPRNEYADAKLTARLKHRATNADISDLKKSIIKSLEHYKGNKPISLYSIIVKEHRDKILQNILDELTPGKFEHLIKWYFERIGASHVNIPSKNERDKQGDADVIAVFEPLKTIIYIQAKFHKGETSKWALEQIQHYKNNKEAMDDGYSKIAWVVTSGSDFSQQALDLAKEYKVLLLNGEQFTTMLMEAGILNLDKL